MHRDRILSEGPGALADAELLSVLLAPRDELLPHRLLSRGLSGLSRATAGELLFTAGMGGLQVTRLLAAIELGRRIALAPSPGRPRLLHAEDIAALLWAKLAVLRHEEVWAVLLSARRQESGCVRSAPGGITACSVSANEALLPLPLPS